MPVETDADRALFLDADEFGVSGTYTKQGAAAVPLAGIFDREAIAVALGAVDLDDQDPQFLVAETDIPDGAGHGDAVSVGGENWRVRNIQPDGTGMAVIKLEKN